MTSDVEQVFSTCYAASGGATIAYAARQGADDPESISQEVWSAIWERLVATADLSWLHAGYVYQSIRNAITDQRRRKDPICESRELLETDAAAGPPATEVLRLHNLTPAQREAIELLLAGHTQREIAALLAAG